MGQRHEAEGDVCKGNMNTMRTRSLRTIRKATFLSALKTCLASLTLTLSLTHACGQAGGVDPSFNPLDLGFGNGDGPSNTVYSTAVQADGKIIIGGNFTSYNGTGRNRIARLNADGSLDTGFNPGTGASSVVYSSTVQADGKILIGGDFTS